MKTLEPNLDRKANRIFMWHWGKEGAGAKFTMALRSSLNSLDGRSLHVSAARHSDLADSLRENSEAEKTFVSTFGGNKHHLSGQIAAALALLKLPLIGFEFKKVLDQYRPDLALCSFQSLWDLAALPVLRKANCPFVLVVHDAEPHPGDHYPFRATIMKWQIDTADGVVVLSDHVADTVQSLYAYPEERIFKIPHGRFDFESHQSQARLFPSTRKFHLLFLGRITDYKGLPLLLEAYQTLLSSGHELSLTIAGSGNLGPARNVIERLPHTTLIHEWLSDQMIARCLADADAVVLPYLEASQSGIAASAFSSGLPVIATPVGGLTEQIQDGVTGLIAHDVSARALAEAISKLATTPTLYERLSEGALDHAETALDWNRIGFTLATALDQIVALPRRRAV